MSATGMVFQPTPIRGAALKQIIKSIDPEKATTDGKVRMAREQALRTPKKKTRSSIVKTPKATPKKVVRASIVKTPKATPKKVDPPPTSAEPEEKWKKLRKAGKAPRRDLREVIDREAKRKYATVVVKKRAEKRMEKQRDEATSDQEEQVETTWYDGPVRPEDLDIEILRFKLNTYFLGLYKILHLVSIDESKGATYIVFNGKYELVLRINFIQKDDMEQLNTELKFLEMMELNTAQHFFSTLFDVGFVNKHEVDGLYYYLYIYRGGPTLKQCLSICHGKVSSESVDRLAGQVVKVFEQLCGQGYRLVNFCLGDFTIDARSRVVFLSNLTNIVKVYGVNPDEVEEIVDITAEQRKIGWVGDQDFAPITWHEQGDVHVMSERDSIESLIYMLIHMHTGQLPWTNKGDKLRLKLYHSDLRKRKALIKSLPPSLQCLWVMIRASGENEVDFANIHRMFTRYQNDDEEFRYDWESSIEPTEDQLRLITMKRNIADMQRKMSVMQAIFDNEELLTKR
ncbi:hypothetical protein PMAYCL1PPCAC_31107 [Pristionchus mayeri]|uniref:Uncharacterized protein n=1 Tax=Pristionchus mayeri TaxID=1317129 RepID=A0AAN5IC96_9BILA|nr:hypothetical protein PMAYCL1PPCAC_31107 [Pristionchus mayeri]